MFILLAKTTELTNYSKHYSKTIIVKAVKVVIRI